MRAFVVDAFTAAPFRGNPAGVVLLDEPADAAWMQDVAREFRHSETAFVHARPDGDYDLRWFTPTVEVKLCGHATLASAHVLLGLGARGPFAFHTLSGVLHASEHDDGAIALDFPAKHARPVGEPAGLRSALGAEPVATSSDGSDLLAELRDAAAVRELAPDIAALAQIECRGVIVTALADDGDADFVSRFFGARVGVGEDPVTGSAHCALAPYWAARLGRSRLMGAQLSERGGRVGVELRGERVLLTGRAVTVLEGDLRV